MAIPLDEPCLAADVVKAVGEKEYVCLKGYILKTQDSGLIKFIPNLEDPNQYLLIPIEDIYYNHITDEVPFRVV